MSFIYVHIIENKIRILLDTKVWIHPDDKLRIKKILSIEEFDNIEKLSLMNILMKLFNLIYSISFIFKPRCFHLNFKQQ